MECAGKLNPALKSANKISAAGQVSVAMLKRYTTICNFNMMASMITWIYADRLKADPERRHKGKGLPVLPFRMFGGLSLRRTQ